jgi:hypothetical protein
VSETDSGFSTAIAALSRAGVDFVLVGVGGINFYARDPDHAFSTLDVAVLLAPEASNLRLALLTLSDLGFSFAAGGEPFLDLEDEVALASIIRLGTNLSARHPRETQLDLMLSIAGFSYEEIAGDAARFNVEGSEVRVGRLQKLLRSKELSGRPKDIEFLRAFSARIAAEDE